MAQTALEERLGRLRPGRPAALGLATLVVVELLLAGLYVTSPAVAGVADPFTFVWVVIQPFVWIDVALLAALTTRPPPTSQGRRYAGVLVGAGYFLVLAYFGGLLGTSTSVGALDVNWVLPPGYSPRLFYDGALLRVAVEPYKLVGYLALAYLVYVTILDAAGAALSGVVGLFSCVSCTWPLIGTVAASLFGGSSAVASAAMDQAYPLSTLVFLSAVALLWWRPGR